MYKGNSQSMQRRASRLKGQDVAPDGKDIAGYATDAAEKRNALGLQKQKMSERVRELKDILGVKSDTQHKRAHVSLHRWAEYEEWGVLSKRLKEIDIEIKSIVLPRVERSLSNHMMDILEASYPDLFEDIKNRARKRIVAEQKKNGEQNAH